MTQQYRILVVDDEPDLCEIISFNLQAAGHSTTIAHSGEEALQIVARQPFDLILLDIMMGALSGLDVARYLKQSEPTARIPIIFLTARDTEDDILAGFDLGADDYISKPFRVRELTARCQAVLRRSSVSAAPADGLRLDEETKLLYVDGTPVNVSPTEYAILSLLMSHPGRVFSRHDLLSAAWSDDVVVLERTVDVAINRLRHKLGAYAPRIASRARFGYYYDL